ncbi:MAG: DMT family transporter [Rhodospirillaceae bacterium]|nr:DMT family transporter [Rhodospirillaceae bacterium]
MEQSARRAQGLMLLSTVLVATSFPVGAAITHDMDSVVLTLLRFTLAALLFGPIVAWRYGLPLPSLSDLARYGAISACLVIFFWGMFSALRLTSALNTATIFTLAPAVAAVASAILLREKLGRAARLALPVGMLGAVWVIFRGDLDALLAMQLGKGDAIFFGATIAMSCFTPMVKLLHRGEPMARMTFWTLVTGAGWLFLLSLGRLGDVSWGLVPGYVYGGIAYLAVFTTILTFFITQASATVIGPTKVMSFTYLTPPLVLLIGLGFGDHLPPMATYPGLILIIGATIILQRATRVSGVRPAE